MQRFDDGLGETGAFAGAAAAEAPPTGEIELGAPRRRIGDVATAIRLAIIVPAHDEGEAIGEAVHRLRAVEADLSRWGCSLSILVVDDGSSDATHREASSAGADRVLRHRTNRGLGAAVRTGLVAARNSGADIAVKFDADLQHSPDDLLALIQPILADEADIVYGDRTGRIEYRMPLVRRIGNLAFTALMRGLTGWPLRDSQPGIFAVSRAYLETFYLPGDYNYTQQILLDAFHKGMRFEHVAVGFRPRRTGRSFISFRYPFKVAMQIVLVLVGVRPMKIFGTIGVLFLALAGAVFSWQLAEWLLAAADKPVRSVNLVLGTGLFGLQTLLFGLLAELIVRRPR